MLTVIVVGFFVHRWRKSRPHRLFRGYASSFDAADFDEAPQSIGIELGDPSRDAPRRATHNMLFQHGGLGNADAQLTGSEAPRKSVHLTHMPNDSPMASRSGSLVMPNGSRLSTGSDAGMPPFLASATKAAVANPLVMNPLAAEAAAPPSEDVTRSEVAAAALDDVRELREAVEAIESLGTAAPEELRAQVESTAGYIQQVLVEQTSSPDGVDDESFAATLVSAREQLTSVRRAVGDASAVLAPPAREQLAADQK